jgi:hypothetical protein
MGHKVNHEDLIYFNQQHDGLALGQHAESVHHVVKSVGESSLIIAAYMHDAVFAQGKEVGDDYTVIDGWHESMHLHEGFLQSIVKGISQHGMQGDGKAIFIDIIIIVYRITF